ncbi:hypothetical protein ACEWY4_017230 [Coilia grayii]|uniref:Ig-like domain-containing protein n=1 Tax=Coilia grayii TaxID=363190 RepID=A0ABD1JG89_9TELE
MGTSVSTRMGTSVSSRMGTSVSSRMGTSVSSRMGTSVSTRMGTSVSSRMGTSVSSRMGTSVSSRMGTSVSSRMGTSVSSRMGTSVSSRMGTSVSSRMGTSVCMSAFLLLCFITGSHLSPHVQRQFLTEGDFFQHSYSAKLDYIAVYRVYADGDVLLFNCSQPETLWLEGITNITCKCCQKRGFIGFIMNNLTVSQSGEYRAEAWRRGIKKESLNIHLTVCAGGGNRTAEHATYDGSVPVCKLPPSFGQGSSVQLYRHDEAIFTLVLDTNSSMEPIQEDLKGWLHVDLNASVVRLSGFMNEKNGFTCTIWRGAQCQHLSYTAVNILQNVVFADEEENLSLQCIFKGDAPGGVQWSTPAGDVRLSRNQTFQQEVMYMLNGSHTGDFSLIIPSVSQQHSGEYRCQWGKLMKLFYLYLCTELSPLHVVFSHGESVLLNVSADSKYYLIMHYRPMCGVRWYRQKVLQPRVLIFDLKNEYLPLPEDLRGRVTESRLNYSLLISNLTAEDSGVYTWRDWTNSRTQSHGLL